MKIGIFVASLGIASSAVMADGVDAFYSQPKGNTSSVTTELPPDYGLAGSSHINVYEKIEAEGKAIAELATSLMMQSIRLDDIRSEVDNYECLLAEATQRSAIKKQQQLGERIELLAEKCESGSKKCLSYLHKAQWEQNQLDVLIKSQSNICVLTSDKAKPTPTSFPSIAGGE